jgi:integrase
MVNFTHYCVILPGDDNLSCIQVSDYTCEFTHDRSAQRSPCRTLGCLISRYRLPCNPNWVDLAPRTRSDYQKVFDWLAPYHDLPLADINLFLVEKIRDTAFERRKQRFANHVLQVMKTLFNWAIPEHLQYNPAAPLKAIQRSEELPEPNRRWADDEFEIMSSKARGGLKVALALGRYAALRSEILVKLLWSEYDGTAIECRVHNNEKWRQEVCPELKAILDETPRKADTIVTSELGRPYTLSGLEYAFRRLRDGLVVEGRIKAGLTFEGLRLTGAQRLAELGADPRDIAKALGQKSLVRAMQLLEDAKRKG